MLVLLFNMKDKISFTLNVNPAES